MTDETTPTEHRLADVRQLTFGGENAEAYWSPDGQELIFQSYREPFGCDQIFRLPVAPLADGSAAEPSLVSTGKGRTTCAYFSYPAADHVVYSSTHVGGEACPPTPSRSEGYVWPLYAEYEIYRAKPDGSELEALTASPGYDAEATVCPVDGSIVFTSVRDGDLELYRMDADGANVQRLTSTPGYDGGAFFSADCSKIVWRASRFADEAALADYRDLLAKGLVRPGKLEIWVANADGTDARQITSLGAASFAPYFFPHGERVIFSSNYGDPRGREFDLWAVDIDGGRLERITKTPEFDGFPVFSPDGRTLAFASNRNHARDGETNLFVARWRGDEEVGDQVEIISTSVDEFLADVRWLADDARQGRGLGTAGLTEAAEWIEGRFGALGLEPAGADGTYRHSFSVVVDVEQGPGTGLVVDGEAVDDAQFVPAAFSGNGQIDAAVVGVGYGISAPDLGWNDYEGVDVAGKIVAVRRFVPSGGPFDDPDAESRASDLRSKVFSARENGAVAVIFVDQPASEEEQTEEVPLPKLGLDRGLDAGLPVIFVRREVAGTWAAPGKAHHALLNVELVRRRAEVWNLVAKLPATTGDTLPGTIVVGAHYDHLGMGGEGSLEPDLHQPHNGADDNASGTAALFQVARNMMQQTERRRDLYLVAFAGEELGLLGSAALVRHPVAGLEPNGGIYAMLNMDMIGRLRGNKLQVFGGDSATEWSEFVSPLCLAAGLECQLGGDGFGPSDHTSFYASGIPVLHFFTGVHEQYHKTSDDSPLILGDGAVRVAGLLADVVNALANREATLTLAAASPQPSRGDVRGAGASLGTIPDYAGPDDETATGVLLAGVRTDSAADKAGLRRGDLLTGLAGYDVRNIYDLVFVLRRVKPGQEAIAVVLRDGERVELSVVFEAQRRQE